MFVLLNHRTLRLLVQKTKCKQQEFCASSHFMRNLLLLHIKSSIWDTDLSFTLAAHKWMEINSSLIWYNHSTTHTSSILMPPNAVSAPTDIFKSCNFIHRFCSLSWTSLNSDVTKGIYTDHKQLKQTYELSMCLWGLHRTKD